MARPPLPPIIGNPMLLATGCAVRGCDETGVPRLPTDVTAGLTDGATPPHDGGTDAGDQGGVGVAPAGIL